MIAIWGCVIAAAILGVIAILLGSYFLLWLQAYFSGARVGFLELLLMSLRQTTPQAIVQCKVMAVQSGLTDLSTTEIEALYLAGGNIQRVTIAWIAANRAGLSLDWHAAAAIELAGRDVMEAVRTSVHPKVIDCPDPKDGGGDTLYGVAQDGVQLRVRVRVTVRSNLLQIVGGATEATVIARVGQSIISSIGSCKCYRQALADPMVITRKVIAEGLDSQTAFAIVSIDIADIDVGTNIGAKLQIDQAEADVRVALAAAEERRTMAIAQQQEMRAQLAKSRALLMLAEAEIPLAVAIALRKGPIRTKPLQQEAGTRNSSTWGKGDFAPRDHIQSLKKT